jgi:hypothetical protein
MLESMEKDKGSGGVPKKKRLFYKLFIYIHPERVFNDSLESCFMFEQIADDIAYERLPLDHEALLKLAALRMQVLDGDFETGSFLLDILFIALVMA